MAHTPAAGNPMSLGVTHPIQSAAQMLLPASPVESTNAHSSPRMRALPLCCSGKRHLRCGMKDWPSRHVCYNAPFVSFFVRHEHCCGASSGCCSDWWNREYTNTLFEIMHSFYGWSPPPPPNPSASLSTGSSVRRLRSIVSDGSQHLR